jgi:hypothetical protein
VSSFFPLLFRAFGSIVLYIRSLADCWFSRLFETSLPKSITCFSTFLMAPSRTLLKAVALLGAIAQAAGV